MYVVIVYDINVARVDKVRKFLKTYLEWVQNSVLEGNLTKSELRRVKTKLKKMTKPSEDHVLMYEVSTKKYMKREEIGEGKGDTDTII